MNACRYLTGEEPEKLQGYSSVLDKDGRFDTVEQNLSFAMQFPSGILASVSTKEQLLPRTRVARHPGSGPGLQLRWPPSESTHRP
jgi:hypothetical protein